MTESNAVPGFLPSVHGLHFANRFPPGPTVRLGFIDPRWVGVGDAEAGLCGGMSWFVRERFETGLADAGRHCRARQRLPAVQGDRPPAGHVARLDARARALLAVGRHVTRIDCVAGRSTRSGRRSGPRSMPAGCRWSASIRHHGWNPFHLTKDHQVLAFGYDTAGPAGPTTIRLYDPNWPNRDDVSITLLHGGFLQSTGEQLLGVIALG